ncbi:hypothetical protein, partial [Rhodococcus ruber]|uniref:hypothetical protein n=1 Tax=Rhodococcus ruber TaxID=1830 RepID=UPI003555DBD6|nr:hypothetical protein [Rhodococcus ruber]
MRFGAAALGISAPKVEHPGGVRRSCSSSMSSVIAPMVPVDVFELLAPGTADVTVDPDGRIGGTA